MVASLDTPPELSTENVFSFPEVSVGDFVKWHIPGKEHDFAIALVQRVNLGGLLNLSVFLPPTGGQYHGQIDNSRVAVMHKDDPRVAAGGFPVRNGVWELTDKEKQIRALLSRVEKLERKKAEK